MVLAMKMFIESFPPFQLVFKMWWKKTMTLWRAQVNSEYRGTVFICNKTNQYLKRWWMNVENMGKTQFTNENGNRIQCRKTGSYACLRLSVRQSSMRLMNNSICYSFLFRCFNFYRHTLYTHKIVKSKWKPNK